MTLDDYKASTNNTMLSLDEYIANTNSTMLTHGDYVASRNSTSFKHDEYIASTSGTSMLTQDQYNASKTGVTNTQTYSNSVENECNHICKESKFVKIDNLCEETTLQLGDLGYKQNNSKLLEKLNDF